MLEFWMLARYRSKHAVHCPSPPPRRHTHAAPPGGAAVRPRAPACELTDREILARLVRRQPVYQMFRIVAQKATAKPSSKDVAVGKHDVAVGKVTLLSGRILQDLLPGQCLFLGRRKEAALLGVGVLCAELNFVLAGFPWGDDHAPCR